MSGAADPLQYICCVCGLSIDPAVQALFAHITCLDEKFGSALAPEIWFDIEVFSPPDA